MSRILYQCSLVDDHKTSTALPFSMRKECQSNLNELLNLVQDLKLENLVT